MESTQRNPHKATITVRLYNGHKGYDINERHSSHKGHDNDDGYKSYKIPDRKTPRRDIRPPLIELPPSQNITNIGDLLLPPS